MHASALLHPLLMLSVCQPVQCRAVVETTTYHRSASVTVLAPTTLQLPWLSARDVLSTCNQLAAPPQWLVQLETVCTSASSSAYAQPEQKTLLNLGVTRFKSWSAATTAQTWHTASNPPCHALHPPLVGLMRRGIGYAQTDARRAHCSD
jgi:hypothetical protein